VDIITKSLIWRFLSWLPGFFLRKTFTKERLASLIEINVRAHGDQIIFNCGERPHVSAWLEIRNCSHFIIELDRLTLEVLYTTKFCELFYLHRKLINPGEKEILYIDGSINSHHIESLSNLKDKYQCSIKVIAYFNNKIHNFGVDTEALQGVHVQFSS
jgi:hypothetical protein